MSGWGPALRIARRSVRRSLGRSILTAAMIAVPVAGVTVADGIVRTTTDRDVDVTRAMGTADLRVDVHDREEIDPTLARLSAPGREIRSINNTRTGASPGASPEYPNSRWLTREL